MDELERALRAVLDDPAQLQELRELAGSMGFSVPQAQPERAPVPDPPESEPKPVQAVFQQQPLPEPAAAMLRQAGKMDKRQEALLLALKPFLRKERQEKIDRALHAARLASLASLALNNRGRSPGAKETPCCITATYRTPQASIIRHASARSRRRLRPLRLRSLCACRLLPRLRRLLPRPVRRSMADFCRGCCRAALIRGIF